MQTYTVSFFGHREIVDPIKIENKVEKILVQLIKHNEFIEFLVGRDGEFDILISSIIKRLKNKYNYSNIALTLVLPYTKSEFLNNVQYFLDYYDEVEICKESSVTYYKAAIQVRNRCMVDRSDLIISFIQHSNGGAYETVQYALRKRVNVINLAECE